MRRLRVPIWREGRVALEGVGLYRSRPALGRDVPRGDGRPVLLIPGYLMGDLSLAPLASWLRHLGYAPEHAGIAANVGCVTRTTGRLVKRLEAIADAHAARPVIVGHSLGGVLARLLAVQRPDLVGGVIGLGSPLVDPIAVHPLVSANVRLLGALGGLGLPGVLTRDCLSGPCCAESRRLLQAGFPAEAGFVSIYSRSDGIVDWHACLDPWAEHVEVDSSHIGLPVNAAVHRIVAERLAGFARRDPQVHLRDRRTRLLKDVADPKLR
jgi:triacylglycerol lipase